MLIHLGDNRFIELDRAVAILNLATVDPSTQARARTALHGEFGDEVRTAVLVADGKWLGSTLRSTAIAGRGLTPRFENAVYIRKPRTRRRLRGTANKESSAR